MNHAIYAELKRIAKTRGLAYYSDIAPLADLDMSLDRDRAEIGKLLGEISEHEHEQGKPLLSAVIVHKEGGRPGKGFFTLARELELIKPGEDEEAFWSREVERVRKQWGS